MGVGFARLCNKSFGAHPGISQTSRVPGPTSLPIRLRNPKISQSGDSKAQRGQLQKRLLGQRRVLPSRRLHIHLARCGLWTIEGRSPCETLQLQLGAN